MKHDSQIFDFSRFADCLKRDIALNGRAWILRGLLMLAVCTILLISSTWPRINISGFNYSSIQFEASESLFHFCAVIFCSLGASLFMENMTTPGSRLNTLMSPASMFEKFLSRWIICVLVVTLGFLICFSLAELFRLIFISVYFGDTPGLRYVSIFEFNRNPDYNYYFWTALVGAQATFVLGSTVSPKNSLLKTFGTVVVLAIAFSLAVTSVFNIVCAPGNFWINDTAKYILRASLKLFPVCWVVFCYITSFYRMKESEIINRL